jgi:exopolysaccharide production protein ExoQ
MPPPLALIAGVVLIVALFREDKRTFQTIPTVLWLPLIYLFILASRLPSQWMSNSGSSAQAFEEGNPLDRVIWFGLLLWSLWLLSKRPFAFRLLFRDNWPLTVYLAFTFASAVWSDFPLISVKRWVRDLGFYTTIGLVATEPDVELAVRLLFRRFAYLVLPLSTVVNKYFPAVSRSYDGWTGRQFLMGVSTSKNGLGALALICGLYLVWDCFAPYRNSKRSFRTLAVNLSLLGTAWWLLTISDSATSLMCFLLGSALIALMYLLPRSISPRAVGWTLIVGLIAYVPLESLLHVKEMVIQSAGRDSTLTGRTDVWDAVLDLASRAPILGAGYESFWLGPRLEYMWRQFPWGPTQAHNGYLEVYANLGIVGGIVVFLLFCFFFSRIDRSLKDGPAFSRLGMVTFIAFVFYNLTEAAIKPSVMLFALMLLAIGVSVRSPDEARNDAGLAGVGMESVRATGRWGLQGPTGRYGAAVPKSAPAEPRNSRLRPSALSGSHTESGSPPQRRQQPKSGEAKARSTFWTTEKR